MNAPKSTDEKKREAYFEALPQHLETMKANGASLHGYVERHANRLLSALALHHGREVALDLLEAEYARPEATGESEESDTRFSEAIIRILRALRVVVENRDPGMVAIDILHGVAGNLELGGEQLTSKKPQQ
jgi:hypothetical protein